MTILIVDDDRGVADAVRMVLEEAGYAVRTSAQEAYRACEEMMPRLCLLDVWLKGEDGLELAAEARRKGLPLIIMSGGGPGRSLEAVTARADALGASAVLYKPFDDDELLAAVRRALGQDA